MVGITKRKEAVAKWNIIKHQKAKYTCLIEDVTKVKDYSEYSLHQEFSTAKTKEVERNVKTLYQYLEDKDLLKDGNLINITSGEIIDDETKRFYLDCIERGEKRYADFQENRIVQKTMSLFKTITQPKLQKHKAGGTICRDKKKETMAMLRTVDIARSRCYDVKLLLSYELTTTSYFLMDDDGYMRSSKSKSELYIRFEQIPYNDLDIGNYALFVDFMAYASKLDSQVTKCGLKTFGDFALNIWNTIMRQCYQQSYRLFLIII